MDVRVIPLDLGDAREVGAAAISDGDLLVVAVDKSLGRHAQEVAVRAVLSEEEMIAATWQV